MIGILSVANNEDLPGMTQSRDMMAASIAELKVIGVQSGYVLSAGAVKKIAITLLIALCGVCGDVLASDVVKPKNKKHVLSTVVLPASLTCDQVDAFGIQLGKSPEESPVKTVRTNVKWSDGVNLSEFLPNKPWPPFTRFFFIQTPISKKIAWAMGVAYFRTEDLAEEAALEIMHWYSNALEAPVSPFSDSGMYMMKAEHLKLMVLVVGKTVRVSCSHPLTNTLMLTEALSPRR